MLANCVMILASIATVKSARILVVAPTPARSHHVVFQPMIQELVNRNHEVTAITTDPVYPEGGSPKNLKEINLHNVSYTIWLKDTKQFAKSDGSNISKMNTGNYWLTEVLLQQLKDKSVLKLIGDKKTKFDLLILELCIPGTLVFSHIFKAPVIFMATSGPFPGNMKMIGSESHPLLYPIHFHEKIYNLTIWEKMWEFYTDIVYSSMSEKIELDYDRKLKSVLGTDTPSLNELKNNVHLLFLNIHPLWGHNQPVSPNVAHIWGVHNVHKPSAKLLPKELLSYMDSSKHGVIYFSFGSIFKTSEIPPEIVKMFLNVFSRLPYDILWKWDMEELPGKSENIKISKWFPQSDLLRHPNLKLFITHCGLQSTGEAIASAVPLIGIPQFADQEYNAEKYVYFKIGIKLNYKLLTFESLEEAIKTVLTDYSSYKKNIIQLRTQMQDQSMSALERAIYRIEYVLRHGALHLRPPAANMSWPQYYELENVIIVLTGLLVLAASLIFIVYTCLLSVLRFIKRKLKLLKKLNKYKLI